MESFDEIELSKAVLGDKMRWLQEGMEVRVRQYKGRPISVAIPARAEYEVADTVMASAKLSNDNSKPATLTNGVVIKVPHFVKLGDRLQINTEDGTYAGKA